MKKIVIKLQVDLNKRSVVNFKNNKKSSGVIRYEILILYDGIF